jgi:hypothetical protein
MKKVLIKRGFRHCPSDNEFTRHGDYARNTQYVYSREFKGGRENVVDLLYLSADLLAERLVIGFFRENVSIENGVLENADTSIPLAGFSVEAFEKALSRLIPRGVPLRKQVDARKTF